MVFLVVYSFVYFACMSDFIFLNAIDRLQSMIVAQPGIPGILNRL